MDQIISHTQSLSWYQVQVNDEAPQPRGAPLGNKIIFQFSLYAMGSKTVSEDFTVSGRIRLFEAFVDDELLRHELWAPRGSAAKPSPWISPIAAQRCCLPVVVSKICISAKPLWRSGFADRETVKRIHYSLVCKIP